MYEYEEVRIKMDLIQKNLLEQVAGLHEIPEGAYNIRANGTKLGRNTTANIDIVTKTDKDGIDIIIKPGTVNESVHIPVLLSESGMQECVYNDFYIGEGADVTIVAGCGNRKQCSKDGKFYLQYQCDVSDFFSDGHRLFFKTDRYVKRQFCHGGKPF